MLVLLEVDPAVQMMMHACVDGMDGERQQRIGHDIKLVFLFVTTPRLWVGDGGVSGCGGVELFGDNLYSYTVIEPSVMILLILHLSPTQLKWQRNAEQTPS